jgi:AbrB family looped-hinge helix DNA binding protein
MTMIVKVDGDGEIHIPSEMGEQMGVKKGDRLEVILQDGQMVLKPKSLFRLRNLLVRFLWMKTQLSGCETCETTKTSDRLHLRELESTFASNPSRFHRATSTISTSHQSLVQ